MWVIGVMDSTFIARMEQVLAIYRKAYDERFPVVCYDERPCFLIGEIVKGFEMKSGQVARQHYAYEKNGSCNLLMTIEPLTGKRIGDVFDRRRKREFALHLKRVAEAFPKAEKIIVILDNLNTHNASSFYEVFSAEEAFALSQKFEFVYTPKSASWLNMIEIEFSAISRLCLNRRIPSKEELECEVMSIIKDREEKEIKIDWQFSIEKARRKLNRHYEEVNEENSKYNKT
jgi:transposase